MTTRRRLRLIETDDAPMSETETATGAAAALRVALATGDMTTVNAHFAGARTLALYDVTATGWSLVEAVQFEDITAEDGAGQGHQDDRIAPRLAALAGCALLFVRAIGGPAAARVVAARVHPVKLMTDEPIDAVLERLRGQIAGTPPPWLRKAMRAGQPDGVARRDFMDDDQDDDDDAAAEAAAGER